MAQLGQGQGYVGILNLAQLAGFGDSYIVEGDQVFVLDEGVPYVYRLTFGTPDGVNIVKSVFLPGAWLNSVTASQSQAAWFIDGQNVSGNASDSNVGDTALAPLLTHKEFRRRIGFGPLRQQTTITIMSDMQASDILDTNYDAALFQVDYVGVATTVAPKTILAYTSRDPTTSTPNLLTTTTATNWTTFVGGSFVVTMTSGAASGLKAYPLVNTGANQARFSDFIDSVNFLEIQPAPGDTFVIQTIPKVPQAILGGIFNPLFSNLHFLNAGDPFLLGRTVVGIPESFFWLFNDCIFNTLSAEPGQGASFINCKMNKTIFCLLSPSFWFGGCVIDATQVGCTFNGNGVAFLELMVLQGGFILANIIAGIGLIDDVGFFDHTGKPSIHIVDNSVAIVGKIWGGVAGQFGITLDKTGFLTLSGTDQFVNSGDVTHQVSLPNAGAVTYAAARAGIKDGATSAATTMPE